MDTLGLWGESIVDSISKVWASFIMFTPKLFGAVLVMVLGVFIAIGIAKIVRRIINAFRITAILQKTNIDEIVERAGLKFDVGQFGYWIVKWFLVIAFFMAAAEILNLPQVSQFLGKVLFYVPNVIVAVLIMLIGTILANFLSHLVEKSAKAADLTVSTRLLAELSRWSVLIFSLMAALIQLKIAADLIRTLFTGLIAMLAIAGGIAFGLGGKDEAKRVVEKLKGIRNKNKY